MLDLNEKQITTLLLAVDVLRTTAGLPDPKEAGTINWYNAREVWDLKEALLNALHK